MDLSSSTDKAGSQQSEPRQSEPRQPEPQQPEPQQPQWLTAGDECLAASNTLADAIETVAGFAPQDPAQADAREQVLQFAAAHPDALHRTCLAGHFTASAWVVDSRAQTGLVLLHAKINRWLQPGGHADGDACLAGVALRECSEETGIAGLQIWSEPVDIDVHLIAAMPSTASGTSGGEPEHLHLDIRYVAQAPADASARGNHESKQLRWVGENELADPSLGLDDSTLRLARYGFGCARQ